MNSDDIRRRKDKVDEIMDRVIEAQRDLDAAEDHLANARSEQSRQAFEAVQALTKTLDRLITKHAELEMKSLNYPPAQYVPWGEEQNHLDY